MEIKDPNTIGVIKFLSFKRHMTLRQDLAIKKALKSLNIKPGNDIKVKNFVECYLGEKRFWETDVYNYLSIIAIQVYIKEKVNIKITIPEELPYSFDNRYLFD